MPYINPSLRKSIRKENIIPETEGQLNYKITDIIHKYIAEHGMSYHVLNEVIDVLECAKLELYRQIAAPYEDDKKLENGPISRLDENFYG